MTDDEPFYQGMLDSNEEFQDGDLGEAALEGRCGFHTFYDNEHPLDGTQTAMHKALANTLETVNIDRDRVEAYHGEVTPQTVVAEFRDQIEATAGRTFTEQFVQEFERALQQQVEDSQEGSA